MLLQGAGKEESKIKTLDRVNFDVKKGELVAITGSVGSGKVWVYTPKLQ
jgi:ABC-type lipoprotein export system ATPase subunit